MIYSANTGLEHTTGPLAQLWLHAYDDRPELCRHFMGVSYFARMLLGRFMSAGPMFSMLAQHCISAAPGGGGPRVVVSTAAFHARVRGSVPGLGGLQETKMFLPHPRVKVSIAGSLRDREVACSASVRQGSNFESCVLRTVSSQSSHQPQEVYLAQFSLYVHKGGLKPDSFHLVQHRENVMCLQGLDISIGMFDVSIK